MDLLIDGTPVVTPQVRGGFLKALAVTSPGSDFGLAEVPAAAETISGFAPIGWFGLLGPAAMPASLIRRLAEDARCALTAPDLHERLRRDFGAEVIAGAPAEFAETLAAERRLHRTLVREVGAFVD